LHLGLDAGGVIRPRSLVSTDALCVSQEFALREALSHLAQNQFSPDQPDVIPSYLTDPSDIASYRSWARWQTAYNVAKNEGLDDPACRKRADS